MVLLFVLIQKNILGPQCDEMICTVSKPSEERDVKNQTFGSASSTEKDTFDRKRKVDEGGLIDDRRSEKYLKYADKRILVPQCDEMIHTVSKLCNDKDVKNQTFGSASSMEKDVFYRKRIADEGGSIDERRPEKYSKNEDKHNLGQHHDEVTHPVSNLAKDKDEKNNIFSSASATKSNAVDGKKRAEEN